MALREEGSDKLINMWITLRKLDLDDKQGRGDLAFFMVWRSGVRRYVEDYATK